MRLLILLAAIIIVIFALRSLLPKARPRTRDADTPEKMVSCAKCKLYLPESEALAADLNFFCNREHHKAWLEDHSKKG